jgi:hypothetical protein
MADIDRSSQEREKITTKRKAQLLVQDIAPDRTLWTIWCRRQKCCSWYGRLALKSIPGALLRLDRNAARGTQKPQSEKKQLVDRLPSFG